MIYHLCIINVLTSYARRNRRNNNDAKEQAESRLRDELDELFAREAAQFSSDNDVEYVYDIVKYLCRLSYDYFDCRHEDSGMGKVESDARMYAS